MFRSNDKDEELKRLQAQLLAEEEDEEEDPEEYLDEEALDSLLEEQKPGDTPKVYQNFSNNYGKNLRNYASGYKAYNSDRTDLDPEELSQELLKPKSQNGLLWFAFVLVLLMAVVVVAIAFLFQDLGGILG